MRIAVDFDGTIVKHIYPKVGCGVEIPGAIDTLRYLQGKGCKVSLWTSRAGYQLIEAVEFCTSKGLTFDSINCNADDTRPYGVPKMVADVYIDDRSWHWCLDDANEGWKPCDLTESAWKWIKQQIDRRL